MFLKFCAGSLFFLPASGFGSVSVSAQGVPAVTQKASARRPVVRRVVHPDGLSEQEAVTSQIQTVLDYEPKPWFNVTARDMVHSLVEEDGRKVFGNVWKSDKNWLVIDGILSEQECKHIRDDMDRREAATWATGLQETKRYTRLGADTRTKNQFALKSSDFVKDGARCSKKAADRDDKTTQLFLKARRRITAAVRTFFEEGHMIHPEHTTVQRRSRPDGKVAKDDWFLANEIHQGVHADNCQISFLNSNRTSFCAPDSNTGFVQRSHTAVMYLSGYEHSSGGELFFTDISSQAPQMKDRQLIPLKCGRLVSFESGPHNLHGVSMFKGGSRYAFDIWMTTQPEHFEYTHNEGLGKCAKWEENTK